MKRHRSSVMIVRVRCLPSTIAAGWLVSSLAVAAPAPGVDANEPATLSASRPTSKPAPRPAARAAADAAPKASVSRLDLSPAVVRSAIAAADEDYAPSSGASDAFGTSPLSPQAKIDRSFQAAEIERCGGPGTLKFDPLPVWGDFVIGGPLLAIPFALHAMATGHCKF